MICADVSPQGARFTLPGSKVGAGSRILPLRSGTPDHLEWSRGESMDNFWVRLHAEPAIMVYFCTVVSRSHKLRGGHICMYIFEYKYKYKNRGYNKKSYITFLPCSMCHGPCTLYPCSRYEVPYTMYHVPCTTYHVLCTRYQVSCTVYHVPKQCTLDHVPCTLYHVPCAKYPVPCTRYQVPCSM